MSKLEKDTKLEQIKMFNIGYHSILCNMSKLITAHVDYDVDEHNIESNMSTISIAYSKVMLSIIKLRLEHLTPQLGNTEALIKLNTECNMNNENILTIDGITTITDMVNICILELVPYGIVYDKSSLMLDTLAIINRIAREDSLPYNVEFQGDELVKLRTHVFKITRSELTIDEEYDLRSLLGRVLVWCTANMGKVYTSVNTLTSATPRKIIEMYNEDIYKTTVENILEKYSDTSKVDITKIIVTFFSLRDFWKVIPNELLRTKHRKRLARYIQRSIDKGLNK